MLASALSSQVLPQRPAVLYIAGSGRSGSTLLERIMGAVPGAVNVGEMLDLPRRVLPRNERCGCGVPFSECPFWTAVGDRYCGGWDEQEAQALHDLQVRVARQRHIPRLARPHPQGRFGSDLADYSSRMRRLYTAVATEAEADYVVDASKWPALALALARGGLDVRVVNIVRDVRGVANSLARGDVVRPHTGPGRSEAMYRNSPMSAGARWLAFQAEVDLLEACGLPVARIRYEDLVRDPAPVVLRCLHSLGVAVPPHGLSHVQGSVVTLGPSHGLSGNPSRFTVGDIALTPDLRWRQDMSKPEQVRVLASAAPWLARYAQLGRSALPPVPALMVEPAHRSASPEARDWPLVTAVVATHGRPELVREAIASAVSQDYEGDVEIIVVHDREPPDESLVSLGAPGRNIAVVANVHSPGLAGARNTGVDLARGEFVATLDDDDAWRPPKLRLQVERLIADPDAIALGTGLRLRFTGGETSAWWGRAVSIPYSTLLRNRVKELHSSTLIMRHDAFAKAGRYDEALPHGYAEDYDWVLRLARVGMIGIVPEPLVDIRRDTQSYYRGRASRTVVGLLHFLDKHEDIAHNRRGHARMLGQIAFALSCDSRRTEAVRYAARSIARWPLSPHPYVALAHVVSGAEPETFGRVARRFNREIA